MSEEISIPAQAQRSLRRWILSLKVCLVFVVVPPLLGLVGTVTAMVRAFNAVESPEETTGSSMLAESVSDALMSTVTGLLVSFPAFLLLVISIIGIVRAKRRLKSIEQGQM